MDKFLAISGGVGGAKLALGLSRVLTPDSLALVVNTGDDFEHLGLPVSPDLDTLMYTLSGLSNPETGWGRVNESWNFIDTFKGLGGEGWFNLGDRDLAVHLRRSQLLREGLTLSAATEAMYRAHGIEYRVWPMSDDKVATRVDTAAGELDFQHYFVRDRCEPAVTGIRFAGAERARAVTQALSYLNDRELAGVIICPSNPFLSIDPILAVAELKQALHQLEVPVIAISPLVGGNALKGPTAKIMAELGLEESAAAVAKHYGSLLDGYIIDHIDAEHSASITELGLKVRTAQTVMRTLDDKVDLAHTALEFMRSLRDSTCG